MTDENGELIFNNIVVGNYKIIEVETNEEYELLNEEIVVEVKEDKIKEVVIENKKIEEPEVPEEPETVLIPEQEPELKSEPESEPELEPELTPEPTPIPEQPQIQELPKTGDNQQNNYQTLINVLTISICSIFLLIKKLIK